MMTGPVKAEELVNNVQIQTQIEQFIHLSCEDCEPTEQSVRAFLSQTIIDLSPAPRTFYIKVFLRDAQGSLTGATLVHTLFVANSMPSVAAIHLGTSSVSCPRGCDQD